MMDIGDMEKENAKPDLAQGTGYMEMPFTKIGKPAEEPNSGGGGK